MVMSLAASALGAAELFEYNRKNFLFDRKTRQECEHQIMDFRIEQAQLWREDVRDIIGLTAVKMDTYLIINTVQLGFCVMALCEGRLSNGTPTWLISCHTLSLVGAFMYLLMSVWLAMTASVTAKSYEVRLLTQLVRLPMPTWSQLESARTYASTFEKVDARQMFRIPFTQGTQEQVLDRGLDRAGAEAESIAMSRAMAAASLNDTTPLNQRKSGQSADLWGLEGRGDNIYELDGKIRADPSRLRHLHLVREAMLYWQSYDGFARVSMSIGTNQLVMAMSYYVIAYVMVTNHAMFAGFFGVGLFMAVAAALIRLDMSLTNEEYRLVLMLALAGPCVTCVCASRWLEIELQVQDTVVKHSLHFVMPVAFFTHALWLVFLLHACKVSEQKNGAWLPTGFRSVMYIDVFGWVKKTNKQQQIRRAEIDRFHKLAAIEETHISPRQADKPAKSVSVMAVSSVSYDSHRLPDRLYKSTTLEEKVQPAKVSPGPARPIFGPGISSVSYDSYRLPVAIRPETLPGAGQHAQTVEVSEGDFIPTTFVPREKNPNDVENSELNLDERYRRPGLVPWQIFKFATIMLAILWGALGVEYLGQVLKLHKNVHGEPRFVDTPVDERFALGTSEFMQRNALDHGEQLETRWPHFGTRPQGLACYSSGSSAAPFFVASTRFGLLASRMTVVENNASFAKKDGNVSSSKKAIFDVVKSCEAIEGETLQDVTLHCTGASDDMCSALVLHRQGQYLTSCPLSGEVGKSDGAKVSGPIAASWLKVGADKDEQEELVSFALSTVGMHCKDGSVCAFARTNLGRIVELRRDEGDSSSKGSDANAWIPSRVLQSDESSLSSRGGGGNLAVAGSAGQYLTVLTPRKGLVEVLDMKQVFSEQEGGEASRGEKPERKADRHSAWFLPTDRRWSSACSTGDNLYMLTDGLWPQIWRFELPIQSDRLSPGVALASSPGTSFLSHGVPTSAAMPPFAEAPAGAAIVNINETLTSQDVAANSIASAIESSKSLDIELASQRDQDALPLSVRATHKATRHSNLRVSS